MFKIKDLLYLCHSRVGGNPGKTKNSFFIDWFPVFTGMTILFTLLSYFLPAPASAAQNFTTDYHVTYNALENGLTRAVLKVTLTNTTTQYYASSYQMQLGFSEIKNLAASDPEGPLKPKITKTNDGHLLDLTFNKKAVGKGDKLTFTINFDTLEVAKKHGKIWEINVPGIANPEQFQTFIVDVKAPKSFGKPTYIKPYHGNDNLRFTKEQLGKSGIVIAFGDHQVYTFQLDYHLHNKNIFPIKSEIALPPTTNYQDVYLANMEPTPNNVRLDKDGNWIAQYNLLPAQKLDVVVRGDVAVRLKPKQYELSLEDYADYTKGMQFWETNDPEIMRLAQELKTPEAIYKYVVETLKYDFMRVSEETDRLGAAAALRNPTKAVCREFTDLFIAITRAAGIPAREINGFAYTQNPRQRPISVTQDILHAWPEYYDKAKKTWVMVDPTWGSTTGGTDYFNTLDNDHVVFVIKGLNSNAPLPAGAYKLNAKSGPKDITIGFGGSIQHNESEVSLTPEFPSVSFSGFPVKGNIIAKNTGSSMVPEQIFSVSSDLLTPGEQMYRLEAIPPFGSITVPVKFDATSILTNRDAGLTIRYTPVQEVGDPEQRVLGASTADGKNFVAEKTIAIAPLFMTPWGIGGIIAVSALSIFIFAAKSGRLPLSRKNG